MEDVLITIEQIKSVLNARTAIKMSEIKKAVKANMGDVIGLFDNTNQIDSDIEKVIRTDIKLGDESLIIRTKDGKYKIRPKIKIVDTLNPPIDKMFEGAAGETAVISELLFREYNANRMMVDKGIDIVATKDNVYKYIQVKTSNVKDGKVYWQIKQERFDAHVVVNLRYILVARYNDTLKYKNEPITQSMFFILTSNDIDRGVKQGWINEGSEFLSIKVKFDTPTGKPVFYNDKETDATYYLNNFDLV